MSHTANVPLGRRFLQRCCERHDCVLFNGFGLEQYQQADFQVSQKTDTVQKHVFILLLHLKFSLLVIGSTTLPVNTVV